jgi:hypothetical protein
MAAGGAQNPGQLGAHHRPHLNVGELESGRQRQAAGDTDQQGAGTRNDTDQGFSFDSPTLSTTPYPLDQGHP